VRGGDQLHRRLDSVLAQDRLHGLTLTAARAGSSVNALQERVNESALGRAKEYVVTLMRLGPPCAGLRRSARQRCAKGVWKQHNRNEL
jgi:hypothetical protein